MRMFFLCKLETSKIKIGKTSRARIICTPEYLSASPYMCAWLRTAADGDGLETLMRTQLCNIKDISHMM